jgi:hypothetical protein
MVSIRSGAWRGLRLLARLTFELLEHALDGAGAAAAGHGDVELVCVRHLVGCVCGCQNEVCCGAEWRSLNAGCEAYMARRYEGTLGLGVIEDGKQHRDWNI